MTNRTTFFTAFLCLLVLVIGCRLGSTETENANVSVSASNTNKSESGANKEPIKPTTAAKKSYKISGTIDDASQEGRVCDTSVEFTVPGTLTFKFTPKDESKGTYTYSGPMNARGEGPYEIKDDGTMIVDGTGCIVGSCATYSHKWEAIPIDPATCKE